MGDYKLKSAEDYVVPEDEQVNAERKRRQLVLLEESIQSIRIAFNKRVEELREMKREISKTVTQDNMQIKALNEALGITSDLWYPSDTPEEWPDKRDEVDEAALDARAAADGVDPLAAAMDDVARGGGGG